MSLLHQNVIFFQHFSSVTQPTYVTGEAQEQMNPTRVFITYERAGVDVGVMSSEGLLFG